MIVNMRIDERLVHGQVTTGWLNYLGISSIIIANDAAGQNEIQKMSLKMAVPPTIKCLVTGIDAAAKVLNDPRSKVMRIMVVVGSPQDALRLKEYVDEIEEINAVNYGIITKPDGKNKVHLAQRMRCDEEDMKAVRSLVEKGCVLYNQSMPSSPKRSLENL